MEDCLKCQVGPLIKYCRKTTTKLTKYYQITAIPIAIHSSFSISHCFIRDVQLIATWLRTLMLVYIIENISCIKSTILNLIGCCFCFLSNLYFLQWNIFGNKLSSILAL